MIDKFIKYLSAEKQYSKLTERAYFGDLCQFSVYTGCANYKEFNPLMVDHKQIRGWVMAMNQEGVAPSSINRRISSLRSFYKYLIREGATTTNPTIKVGNVKKGRRLPSFIEKSKADTILDNTITISNNFETERDSLIVALFYTTGMRLAELVGATVAGVDMEHHEIKILGKGNKERISPLPELLIDKLTNYLSLRNEIAICPMLFINDKGEPISRTKVYGVVNKTLKMLKVDGKCSPHTLRHTFATHLLGAGVGIESVKQLLGHENLSTTQIYAHNTIEQLKKSYNNAHPHTKKEGK